MNGIPSSGPRPGKFELGLVVPCFNEEKVLPSLFDRLRAFAATAGGAVSVLFVDDGSRDGTFALLEAECAREPRFAALRFSRNFGHQTAVTAGLRHARGDVVAVLDADLQDPPEVLLQMLEKWREGYDVVYGVRTERKESWLLRALYSLCYRLIRRVANVELPLDAGDFSLMDRRVVDLINAMPEHNRYVRGLRGWVGMRQTGLPYERHARAAGRSKYNLRRLVKLAFDGLVSFSYAPLRLAIWAGALSALAGFAYLLYAVASRLLHPGSVPGGWTSLVVLMLVFGGIQLMLMGLIGEYVGRIFEEVKRRPLYVIAGAAGWTGLPPEQAGDAARLR